MKNDNIVDFTVSKYMSQTLWHYFFRIIHDITTTNTTLVQTSIILGLVFKVLLSNDIYVFWCWPSVVGLHTFCVVQVENVQYINSMQMLHRASCTLPNIFHVLWARKYNYDKKMCNNMYSILYMYFLCITSCLMLKLEILFGPPWFANFLSFVSQLLFWKNVVSWCERICRVWNCSTCEFTLGVVLRNSFWIFQWISKLYLENH